MNLLERMKSLSELDIKQGLLAVLFAAGDPVELKKLAEGMEIDESSCVALIDALNADFDASSFALTILRLGDSYQLTTRKIYTPFVKKLFQQRKNAMPSQAAMEILAIVAYNQPVTRSFIEQVRGVECGASIGSLVEKGLLEEAGRLELPGRPISYRTTENFLRVFGLSDLSELPDLHISEEEK